MRIILSRKGFDSANGRVPSPIFPSGEMRSLPIPQSDPSCLRVPILYNQIRYNDHSLSDIISDLTGARTKPTDIAHLDPDLDAQSLPRQAGWRPIFGQNNAAESHLRNQRVQAGDIFLFFGWFRRVKQRSGHYHYDPDAPDLHVIFGWLQVERRIMLQSQPDIPKWARYHPHCQMIDPALAGSLYLSTPFLNLPGLNTRIPGGGICREFTKNLQLTAEGESRSCWRLPGWFYPRDGRPPLSYHEDLTRWRQDGNSVLLRSAGRGQEFVLDCDDDPETIHWLAQLLS